MQVEAGALTRQTAERFGGRTALTAGDRQLSFTELNAAANRVGSAVLELGARRGDRVGVLAYNTPEVVEAWFGFEKHNLVRAVLHSHFPMDAHVASLNHIKASTLVFDTRFAEQLDAVRDQLTTVRQLIAIGPDSPAWATPFAELEAGGDPGDPYMEVDEDDPCFLQLTSGTTGMSKPWIKTYRSWVAVISHNATHLDTFDTDDGPVDGPDDVNLHFHPLQWATGFQTLYPYLIRGARTVLVADDPFDAASVARHRLFARGGDRHLRAGPAALADPRCDRIPWGYRGVQSEGALVVFFGTPELLERTGRLLGPVWAHGFGSSEQGAVTTRLLPTARSFFGLHHRGWVAWGVRRRRTSRSRS